jgi:hypothetical protein
LKLGSLNSKPVKTGLELIVAFHTFCTADLFHGHTIHFLVLQVFVEFLVDAVELVIGELNFGFAVTVDTPAHAQV